MRGFRAKALRRLAQELIGKGDVKGYRYEHGDVQRHTKILNHVGGMMPYSVTGTIVNASQVRGLYQRMKKDLRRGGQ